MELRRSSDVTVGSTVLHVETELVTGEGDVPVISSRVLRGESVLFKRDTGIEELRPIFKHSEEILRRIDHQHLVIIQHIQKKQPSPPPPDEDDEPDENDENDANDESRKPTPDARMSTALELLGAGEWDLAEAELRRLLEQDRSYREARELLEVVELGRAEIPTPEDLTKSLHEGSEAFAAGQERTAVTRWKNGLAQDPSSRSFQLLVLFATTDSEERRHRYAEQLLLLGSELLTKGKNAEAYSLLVVAQADEQPKRNIPEEQIETQTIVVEPTAYPPAGGVSHEADEVTEHTLPGRPLIEPPPEETETAREGERRLFGESHDEREAALYEARRAEAKRSTRETNPPFAPSPPEESVGRPPSRVVRRVAPRHRRPGPPTLLYGVAALAALAVVTLVVFLLRQTTLPTEQLDEAARYMNAGQYDAASEAYSGILMEWGELAPAYLGRGRARLAAGDPEGGLADLTRAVELEPEAAKISEELAEVLYSRGEFEKAVTYYERALQADSLSAESLYRLATSLVQLGRRDEALERAQAALEADPSHAEAHFLYGILLNGLGRFEEAERELEAARPSMGESGDFYAALGTSLLEQGKLDAAEAAARQFARFDSEDARAHAILGEVYLSRKQYLSARDELFRALRLNPKEPRAQIALGRTWLAIARSSRDPRDLAKARQILTEAMGVDEGERLMTLGQVAMAGGDVRGAVALLERAIEQQARPREARLALADALYASKDYPGAAAALERAAQYGPSDPAIALSLGLVYSQLNDARRASEGYLKAIQGIGMTRPAEEANGPVMLPKPYVTLPSRLDINRVIRSAYRDLLSQVPDDPTATALKQLAESVSFVIAEQNG